MTAPLPPAAAAGYLTDALRRAGALGAGRVREVAVDRDWSTILSRLLRLRLAYDSAAPAAPTSLVLKTAHPERGNAGWTGHGEVGFYRAVAPATPASLLPRCFDAQWDDATRGWHLLLEDLTDTHALPSVWPLPPRRADCERIIATLARFHAAWWDDARLGAGIGIRPDAAARQQYAERFAAALAHFFDRLDDNLSVERRALYERFVAALPRLFEGYVNRRHVTVRHGDSHVWNCLLPNDGGSDVRLFDWDSWRIAPAASDLAYMMAMHWYPDRRRRLEPLLLDRYHAVLLEQGVQGYDRAALAEDYRRSTLWLLMLPVWQAADNIPPVVWWNNLERILLAVDDLDAPALLG